MYRVLIAALMICALPVQAEDDSYAKLFEVHSRFAAKGSAEAQFKLGEMYEEGRGTEKDLNMARNWYEQAAAQGHEVAKQRLTTLGARVSTDDVKRLEREAQAKRRAEEERQAAALAQQRAEEERARQAALQRRQEEERERQSQQRAEEERTRLQQQQQQRRTEEERARLMALQKRQEEESARRAAVAAAAEAEKQKAAVPAAAPAAKQEDDKSFDTDPCKGSAARFLSTCR